MNSPQPSSRHSTDFPFERSLLIDQPVQPMLYLLLIMACLALFVLSQLADNNLQWFLQINHGSHDQVPATISALITELGNGAIVGTLAVILLVRQPSLAKRVLYATLLTAILMYGAKAFFAAPRPASLLALSDFYIIGDVLKKKSFPSGHTTTAFTVAGVILLSSQYRRFRLCALLLAIAAAWSRIAVGAHWPEDVFMGAALGLCIAGLAFILSRQAFSPFGNYCAAAFLAFATLVGNLTLPDDFPDIPAIMPFRIGFAVLSSLLMIYFGCRVLLFSEPIKQTFNRGLLWLSQHQNLMPIRFLKFGMVGGSGFLVDSAVYFFAQFLGLNHSAARVVSYWCAATNNWFLNRIFTFNDVQHEQKRRQWLKYMLMCVFSFILNWGSYHLLTNYVPFFMQYKFIAFLFGILLGMVTNFTLSQFVIFKNKTH